MIEWGRGGFPDLTANRNLSLGKRKLWHFAADQIWCWSNLSYNFDIVCFSRALERYPAASSAAPVWLSGLPTAAWNLRWENWLQNVLTWFNWIQNQLNNQPSKTSHSRMKNLQPVVNPAIISSKTGVQHLVPEVKAVHDVHLWIFVLSSNEENLEISGILFLAVHNSSIGDLVPCLVGHH